MECIKYLTKRFRHAIDVAKANGDFDDDLLFRKFPNGYCGDACDLLSVFLAENNIKTLYVCGTYEDWQTHAWLLAKGKIIIDITGDQFKNNNIFLNYDEVCYVGLGDEFHMMFNVHCRDVHKSYADILSKGVDSQRLKELYIKIIKYV